MADQDEKGFTTFKQFSDKYDRQREKVERMEEDFLEELRNAFRNNKSRLAREFLEYRSDNPYGQKIKVPQSWGGEATDFTGFGDRGRGEDE